jgi:acetyl-CoA carboxylase biotin carboxyl carrier protein
MDSVTADMIRLMAWAARHDLRHLVHDDGETRIEILRDDVLGSTLHVATSVHAGRAPTPPAAGEGPAKGLVRAPLAGICHLSPDPDSLPFVQPGDRVAAGQTLCLIEAMKVMTAVIAPTAGVVADILVQPAATVAPGRRPDAHRPMTAIDETLLIANRGEIALRVIRACRRLGLRVVCAHSEADRGAPGLEQADATVCIGPARPRRATSTYPP